MLKIGGVLVISFLTLPLQRRVRTSPMPRRILVQHQRELMQWLIAKTFRFDRLHGGEHVFAIGTGLTVSLLDMTELLGQ